MVLMSDAGSGRIAGVGTLSGQTSKQHPAGSSPRLVHQRPGTHALRQSSAKQPQARIKLVLASCNLLDGLHDFHAVNFSNT
jgi:hypothetical protein